MNHEQTKAVLDLATGVRDARYSPDTAFVEGGYVYATNGRICLRTKQEDYPSPETLGSRSIAEDAGKLPWNQSGTTVPMPPPSVITQECEACVGKGTTRFVECEDCDGAGRVECLGCGREGECGGCSGTGKHRGDTEICCCRCGGVGISHGHAICLTSQSRGPKAVYADEAYLEIARRVGVKSLVVTAHNKIITGSGDRIDVCIMPIKTGSEQ